jgi:hypothetical protein
MFQVVIFLLLLILLLKANVYICVGSDSRYTICVKTTVKATLTRITQMGSQNCTDIVNLKMKERNVHITSETCQVKLKLQFHNKFDPWDAIHVEDNQYIWYGSKNIIRLLERSLEKFNWKPIS